MTRVAAIMIDSTDVERLVEFWTRLLDLEVRARYPDYVFLSRVVAGGPSLAFQSVAEAKTVKNRVHLDIHTSDAAEAEALLARVIELGGSTVAEHSLGDFGWTVCADPEGNEFCIAAD